MLCDINNGPPADVHMNIFSGIDVITNYLMHFNFLQDATLFTLIFFLQSETDLFQFVKIVYEMFR